jgi:hypothetical protein
VTTGQPYSADSLSEFVQALADGNRIVRRTSTRLYRDSEGRTRQEMLNDAGEVTEITIIDPVSGGSFVLNPATRTAARRGGMVAKVTNFSGTPGAFTVVVPNGSAAADAVIVREKAELEARSRVVVREKLEEAAAGAGAARSVARAVTKLPAPVREDLGDQTIEGLSTHGTRSTTTIPAGVMGNELPLITVSEQWFSNELQVLVLTKHSDPRVGDTTYRLTNIRRGEPDRSLFQVPTDYTVK